MRRALLLSLAIAFAIACGDNITEPVPERTTAVTPPVSFATTTTEDGLSISTDKDDYQPGDVVHLTGSGWEPGDVLDIVLTDDPLTHDPHRWSVTVEADGTFHDQTYVVDEGDLNVAFTLVATSRATGRSLTVNFTDNIPPGGVTATLDGANSVTVEPGTTISLAISARVTSANPQNSPVTWQSTGWVLLTNPATAVPAGKLANCVDKEPNVTGTQGNGTLGTTTFNITAPTTSGTYDLWLALSDQDGTGDTACGGGGQSTKVSFVGVVTVVVVDQTRPTVTINQAVSQPDPTNASPINFTVEFSEPVIGFAASDVDLSASTVGGTLSKTVTGTGPTTYDVAVSGMTTPGTVVATITEGAAVDAANNTSTASTSTDNSVEYDATAPGVTIDQAGGQADPTNTLPINFTVVFSKPVTDFDAGEVDLSASTVVGTLIPEVTGGPSTYNVAVSGTFTDGLVIASIPGGIAQDASGNGNAASTSDDNQVTYDKTAPTVTVNQAAGQADPTNASPINFTVEFSENVTGFAASDVSFTGSTAAGTLSGIVSGGPKIYTVAVSGMTGDGLVKASVPAGAAKDDAGNDNTVSSSTDNTVTFDNTPPTVTINQASGQADPTNALPINFTVVFSENVADFAAGDVTLTGTAGLGTATATVTGSGKTYNVAVNEVTTGGTVIASIGADKATDAAGNGNTASTSTDNSVRYDAAPPVVSEVAIDPNPTNGSIDVTATATVDDRATGYSKITAAYYRIDTQDEVAMAADDGTFNSAMEMVTASIPAATVAALSEGDHQVCVRGTDEAGNTSAFDDEGACVTLRIDKTPPEVTINRKAGQADPTNESPINFTVVFTENVSDFATGDVSLDGTAGATTAIVTGSGTTYNVAVSGMTGDGSVIVSIASGKAHDAAGNGNNASTSTDNSVVYDNTPPVISCGAADGAWHATDVSIACTASDAPAGLKSAADASFSLTTNVPANTETNNAQTGSRVVFDNAGNSSTAGPIGGNKVDKRAPTVVLVCPADLVILNASVNANWTATDGGSGVTPSGVVPLVTNSIGPKTANVTVQDNVGNSSSSSCGYTVGYSFSGFFAPVDRPNTVNLSKVGQAIPLKWRLTDALGRPVTDVTSVTVKAEDFACGLAGTSDMVEEYAAGSSGLQNQGDGYYQFNWKTPSGYLNSCKKISLVFGSTGGIGYTEKPGAYFTFKK